MGRDKNGKHNDGQSSRGVAETAKWNFQKAGAHPKCIGTTYIMGLDRTQGKWNGQTKVN